MDDILLTMEGEGISFKKSVSQHRAGQIIALLGVEQSPVFDTVIRTPSSTSVRTKSPAVRVRGIRDEVKNLPIDASMEGYLGFYDLPMKADKILWILEYAEHNGIAGLTSVEIDFISKELRERIGTKNFGKFNQRNVRSGYILRDKGTFQIQKKGRVYLEGLK